MSSSSSSGSGSGSEISWLISTDISLYENETTRRSVQMMPTMDEGKGSLAEVKEKEKKKGKDDSGLPSRIHIHPFTKGFAGGDVVSPACAAVLSEPTLMPPPAPAFVEKFTSFVTETDGTLMLKKMAALLHSETGKFGTETTIPRKPYKVRLLLYFVGPDLCGMVQITGIAYPGGSICSFRIHVYILHSGAANKMGNAYLVEFQRRSGCVINFCNFFRAVVSELGDDVRWGYDDYTADLKAGKELSKVERPAFAASSSVEKKGRTEGKAEGTLIEGDPLWPPPSGLEVAPSITLDDTTTDILYDMAQARETDVQREAIHSLAIASETAANRNKMVEWSTRTGVSESKSSITRITLPAQEHSSGSRVVDFLGVLLQSHDGQIVRSAAMVLARLAPLLRWSTHLLVIILYVLKQPLPSSSAARLLSREVRRQVASAFTAIIQHHGGQVVTLTKSECLETLSSLTPDMIEDKRLGESLQVARTLLLRQP